MVYLIFQDKIKGADKEQFLKTVISVASRLGYNPNWLMLVMNSESAGTFSASIKNPLGTAVGLIQFLSSTAKWLGTTTEALVRMTRVQQLEYVFKYFDSWKKVGKTANDYADLYLITFYPEAVGKPDNYVIGLAKGSAAAMKIHNSNPGIVDVNNDSMLSVGEFKSFIYKRFVEKASAIDKMALLKKKQ